MTRVLLLWASLSAACSSTAPRRSHDAEPATDARSRADAAPPAPPGDAGAIEPPPDAASAAVEAPPVELGTLVAEGPPASRAASHGKAARGRADLAIVDRTVGLTLWRGKRRVATVPGDYRAIEFSPDGSVIAAKAQAGPIVLVSADDGAVVGTLVSPQDEDVPRWIDARHVIGASDHEVWVHDVEAPSEPRLVVRDPATKIQVSAVHPSQKLVVRARDQAYLFAGADPASPIAATGRTELSADGARLVWADGQGGVAVWNIAQGRVERTIGAGGTGAAHFGVSEDADQIVVSADGLRLFELSTGTELATLEHGDHPYQLVGDRVLAHRHLISRDGGHVELPGGVDSRARLVAGGDEVLSWSYGPAIDVYRARDGRLLRSLRVGELGELAVGGGTGVASLAHARAGTSARAASIAAAAGDPDRPIAFVGLSGGRVGFVDLDRAAVVAAPALASDVNELAVTADGRWLAIGDHQRVHLLDLQHGTVVRVLSGPTDDVTGLAFSPDGTRLAASSYDGGVRVWSTPDGKATKVMRGYGRGCGSVAWSSDGKHLAWVGDDRLCQWSGKAPSCVEIDAGRWSSPRVRFTPDGGTLVLVANRALFTRAATSTADPTERYEASVLSDLAITETLGIGVLGHTSPGAVEAWSLADGATRWSYPGYVGHDSGTSVSGRVAVTAAGDRLVLTGFSVPEIRILDAATGQQLAAIPAPPPAWAAVAAH
jgi:hypothetical protein